VLENMGTNEDQAAMRNRYWQEEMTNIPFGDTGGVWDHAKAYAERNWKRDLPSRMKRKSIFGDVAKFNAHIKQYASPLMSSIVSKTTCVVCGKKGHFLLSAAAIPMEFFASGELVDEAVLEAVKHLGENGNVVCGVKGCKGKVRKKFDGERTRIARLLVVVVRQRAVLYTPLKELELGDLHGKYTLTAMGHCNQKAMKGKGHYVCTFKFNNCWYSYDDLSTDENKPLVRRVPSTQEQPHTYKPDGFNNAVHFYTKL
jgi:hypothetical protein